MQRDKEQEREEGAKDKQLIDNEEEEVSNVPPTDPPFPKSQAMLIKLMLAAHKHPPRPQNSHKLSQNRSNTMDA